MSKSTSLSHITDGQMTELKRILSRAGLTGDLALEIIANSELATGMVASLHPWKEHLIASILPSPSEQVANVARWNRDFEWGFTVEDFERLLPIPTPPKEEGSIGSFPVLVPYFSDAKETLVRLWKTACSRHENAEALAVSEKLCFCHKGVGRTFTDTSIFGLRWEEIGPRSVTGASWGHEILTGGPSVSIVALAAHSPEWIRSQKDGAWLPGAQVEETRGQIKCYKIFYSTIQKTLCISLFRVVDDYE